MAGIFTRNPVKAILNDESLTPEDRLDQIFALYGRAVQGFVSKADHEAAISAAVEAAKKDAPAQINVKETDDYKQLLAENNRIKTLQTEDFAAIKPQYRDMVYGMLDHTDRHKPYSEQLTEVKEKYGEMFAAEEPDEPNEPHRPQFGAPTQGGAPTGDEKKSFSDFWGFAKK